VGNKRSEHFAAADGVRGLACLTVVTVHATVFSNPSLFPYLTGCGKIGVWLFFTLSAFLLTVRLSNTGFSRAALVDYGLSRFLRIYPLLLVAVAAHFIVGLAIATPKEFFQTAALVAGPVHFWTIPVEVTFYAVLPLLAWALLRIQDRFGDATALGSIAATIAAHQVFWPYWQTPENSIQLIWYLPTFLLGTAAAMMRHRTLDVRSAQPAIAIAIVALIVLSAPLTLNALFDIPPSRYLMDKHLFFGVGYAVLIWCVVNDRGIVRRLF